MLIVKTSVAFLCVVSLLLLTFSSCAFGTNNAYSEVDLSSPTDVQITYRQNVYNTRLSFVSGILYLDILGGDETLEGLKFVIDEESCRVGYSALSHEIDSDCFSDDFFPLVLYKFFSEFNGMVRSENYDDNKMCFSVSRQIYSSFVTFEFFGENKNKAYSLIIN